MRVEPVPNEAALLLRGRRRVLVVADMHLGLIGFHDSELVERLKTLAERFKVDEVIVLGDLKHKIGRAGVERILDGLNFDISVVKGNHDGGLEGFDVLDPRGVRMGKVGMFHGHAKPSDEVMDAKVLIFAHAHPSVMIGGVKERVWIKGEYEGRMVIVMPAFNDLCASTPVNVRRPAGVMFKRWDYTHSDVFMLDGTYLGSISFLSTFYTRRQGRVSP